MGWIDYRMALDLALVLPLAGLVAYVAVLARRMRWARGEIAQAQSALIELARIVGRANRDGGGAGEHDDLRDDLAFLVERGAALADRLEQDLRLGLVRQRQTGTGGAADAKGRVVSLPELKLIKSLREPR